MHFIQWKVSKVAITNGLLTKCLTKAGIQHNASKNTQEILQTCFLSIFRVKVFSRLCIPRTAHCTTSSGEWLTTKERILYTPRSTQCLTHFREAAKCIITYKLPKNKRNLWKQLLIRSFVSRRPPYSIPELYQAGRSPQFISNICRDL